MKRVISKLAIASILFLYSCKKQDHEHTVQPDVSSASTTIEEAYPGKTGSVEKGALFGQAIEFERINGEAVFQGDIIVTPEQLSAVYEEGAGRSNMVYRWPYNIVYYTIDPALPSTSRTRVSEAMQYWRDNARVRFVARTTQPNYVTFRPGDGCSSSVGMTGRQQFITISTACSKGNIIHEINHALGAWHEQSRADQDANVTIHWQNITPGKEHNFQTYTERMQDGFDNGPFDFGSVMMYDPFAFSRNGSATITRRDGSLYSVQRTNLSTGDKALFRRMYLSKDALPSGTKDYFFSGNHYIRVTRGTTGPGTVDAGYPKHISVWSWPSTFKW